VFAEEAVVHMREQIHDRAAYANAVAVEVFDLFILRVLAVADRGTRRVVGI